MRIFLLGLRGIAIVAMAICIFLIATALTYFAFGSAPSQTYVYFLILIAASSLAGILAED